MVTLLGRAHSAFGVADDPRRRANRQQIDRGEFGRSDGDSRDIARRTEQQGRGTEGASRADVEADLRAAYAISSLSWRLAYPLWEFRPVVVVPRRSRSQRRSSWAATWFTKLDAEGWAALGRDP